MSAQQLQHPLLQPWQRQPCWGCEELLLLLLQELQ
jgi:hypothetical protein